MANILLCVSGSIACYKAAALTSMLVKNGHSVKVAATENALKFVGRATFEGLCHNKLLSDLFSDDDPVEHITLSQKWADVIIAYPASADMINKAAAGFADSLFGALVLANNYKKPLLIAPAMNTQMLLNPASQKSLSQLKEWGAQILPSGEGALACGAVGTGRLIEPSEAFEFIKTALKEGTE